MESSGSCCFHCCHPICESLTIHKNDASLTLRTTACSAENDSSPAHRCGSRTAETKGGIFFRVISSTVCPDSSGCLTRNLGLETCPHGADKSLNACQRNDVQTIPERAYVPDDLKPHNSNMVRRFWNGVSLLQWALKAATPAVQTRTKDFREVLESLDLK